MKYFLSRMCDQIGQLLKELGAIFSYKSAQIFGHILGYFEKCNF